MESLARTVAGTRTSVGSSRPTDTWACTALHFTLSNCSSQSSLRFVWMNPRVTLWNKVVKRWRWKST
jgi:hypothetical protein